jgi:hypothetical protein
MQQRQLRLGDILDDYCPRERRLTNHAIVAMVGDEVKQTRCTTCDAEHAFKHGKVPRQRRKADTPAALYSQVLAGGPKRVAHEPPGAPIEPAVESERAAPHEEPVMESREPEREIAAAPEPELPAHDDEIPTVVPAVDDDEIDESEHDVEQGPAHRRLIRATLPRPEGQTPPARPAPEFTIRQPNSRPGRFRPRHQRGASPFHSGQNNGNRSGFVGGGMPRQGGGRPPMSRPGKRHGPGGGRKRSK